MNPEPTPRDAPQDAGDGGALKNLRPARSLALLLAACLFLLIGIRLNELRPLFGGSGLGLVIIVGSIAGAFVAASSVLIRAVRVRRRVRVPAHRSGRKSSTLVLLLGPVVALDLVGIISAAVN